MIAQTACDDVTFFHIFKSNHHFVCVYIYIAHTQNDGLYIFIFVCIFCLYIGFILAKRFYCAILSKTNGKNNENKIK